MTANDPTVEFLLRLGDNCLILGHRLSEWVGHAPVLEEDLGLANVSLDLLGQAQNWLGLAGDIQGGDRDADWFAYRRDAGEFRNALLVEQPNGDFARTMVRQLYFDLWHVMLLEGLEQAPDERIAGIAAKAYKEARYHLERSRDWVIRLGDGTEESHRRTQEAVDELWIFTGELFESDEIEAALADQGVIVGSGRIAAVWKERLAGILAEATLTFPQENWMRRGGRRGIHSEHLGYLLAEMQFLQRAYPDARW